MRDRRRDAARPIDRAGSRRWRCGSRRVSCRSADSLLFDAKIQRLELFLECRFGGGAVLKSTAPKDVNLREALAGGEYGKLRGRSGGVTSHLPVDEEIRLELIRQKRGVVENALQPGDAFEI